MIAMKFTQTAVSPHKYFLSFITLIFAATVTFAQQVVEGRVVDSASNQGLSGISVMVKGTTRGTVTNANGNFRIAAASGEILQFSSASYASQEVSVGNQTTINVSLGVKSGQLNEVVVIGYGQRQRRDLTGSYGTIGERDISKSTYAAPELAMQGRLAGVQVNTPGGNPNSRTSVRIRGVTSFTNSTTPGSNDPLYVIDGVPITEGGAGNPDAVVRDVRTPNNPLALISSTDIESITVLKDASAAAIYGVRAANGVVLITTKRGKGKPRVEINAAFGIQNAVEQSKPVLTVPEYVALYNEAYSNNPDISGGNPVPIGSVFGPEWNPASPKYLGNSQTYYWIPEFFNENAPYKNLNLKLSGSSESLNYYVSADVNQLEGTLKGAYQDRYTLATNISSKVSKVIEVGVMMRGIYAKSENGLGGTDQGFRAPAWQPIYGNGPGGLAPNQYVDSFGRNRSIIPGSAYDPNNANTPVPYFSYVNGAQSNPVFLYGQQTRANVFTAVNRRLGYNEYHNYRAIGNVYVQVTPLKGLRVKGTLYGDYINDINPNLSVWDAWQYGGSPANPYSSNTKKYDTTAIANISIRNRRDQSWTGEVQATYNTVIASKHSLEVTGVANRQEWRWGMTGSSGILYTLDENRFNTSNASRLHNEGSYRKNWEGTRVLIGLAGRASYKFDDKYYLDLTVRRDGSSRFPPGEKWGTFPAVAVGWRLTNEKFMDKFSWLNDLKIRANWGKLGNEMATFGWKYLALVNPGITVPNYSVGSGLGDPNGSRIGGAYLPDFANNDLTWESVTTSGVGFDAVLLDNRLNFTAEYYNRLTTGIIQQVPAPFSAGIQNAIDVNIGEVVNKGFEFSATYNMMVGPVNMGFNANFTTLKNEVTELYNGVNIGGGDEGNIWEGYPINFIRGYKVGGVFQTQAEIDAWRAKYRDAIAGQSATNVATAAYKPGDMYFLDVARGPSTPGKFNMSPDSVINDNDRVYLGKTIPGFFYGFGLNASYKNIDFSIFFRGQGDVQRINDVKRSGESMSSTGLNQLATVLNRWTPTNPSTTIPRAVYGDPRQQNRFSDRWVEDAGFMRLQNLELAYRIPASVLGKTGFIQGIRVYVMGTNLLTFTNYSGVDPENDYNPVARQWVFGLNASF